MSRVKTAHGIVYIFACLTLLLADTAWGQDGSANDQLRALPRSGAIVFATSDANTLPLADIQGNRMIGGILKQLGDVIAERLHRKSYYIVLPRNRLVGQLEAGAVDAVCYYRPEWLDARLNWSEPLIQNEILLVGGDGVAAPKTIEDVRGKTIGTVIGYKYPELDALRGNYLREDSSTMASNIKKLSVGRVSYAVVDQLTLAYYRKTDHNAHAFSTLSITRINASCGFSLVSRIPFEEINSVISTLIRQGVVEKILSGYR